IAHAHQPRRSLRVLGVGACVAGLVLPHALEALGVLARSYEFQAGAITIHPQMLALPALPTQLLLLLAGTVAVLCGALYVSYLRAALERAERRFQIQHWQLQQILPRP